jgi:signal transduction histidine kinase
MVDLQESSEGVEPSLGKDRRDFSGAAVLVIDDTPGNRYALVRILRGAGMRVTEAETGHDGLKLAQTLPDLIVLDRNLPDIAGNEVLLRLRSDPRTSSIPIMQVSASAVENSDRVEGLEAGADAYITHPIDSGVFVATVRALIRMAYADARVQAAAAAWRATFDAIRTGICLLDQEEYIVQVNSTASGLLSTDSGARGRRKIGSVLEAKFGTDAEHRFRALPRAATEPAEIVLGDRTFAVTFHPLDREGIAGAQVVCVLNDITDRKNSEREREALLARAEAARSEAERANAAKADFLAVMSHELRTPLNAIGGYVELLELGIRGPVTPEQVQDLQRIRRSQTYLMSLINDVLNFAKIESGRLDVQNSAFEINQLLESAGELVEPQVATRGLNYKRGTCPPGLRVTADREKVQQILLNLLSNAIKFTLPGGNISVTCDATDDNVSIKVSDTGPGVPEEKREAIFEPFVQIDRRFARDQEGVGLGLAISRNLARRMDGDLTVSSIRGVGSEFTLILPRSR